MEVQRKLPKDPFNLIITHYPGYDNFVVTREQLFDAIENLRIIDSSQSIILALVDNPYEAARIISEKITGDTPILRVIPVDAVLDVYVDRIAPVARDILYRKSADKTETFKIKIDGKLYRRDDGEITRLHTNEAIDYIASFIDRPVNLSEPDWIIYIKTIKLYRVTELASLTVCHPNEIISYAKGA